MGLLALSAALNGSRPLRLEINELAQLQLPCILHWDLNHFVVLKKAGRRSITILDPAVGERRVLLAEVSRYLAPMASINSLRVVMLIRPCFVTSCPRRPIRRVAIYVRQRVISGSKSDESMRGIAA